MTNPPASPRTTRQSLSIGGNATGVIQSAGDNNAITQTTTVTTGTPPEVLNALAAIQAALAGNPATRALADAAAAQAKAEKPDKGAITAQLDAALKVAKTVPDWMEVAGRIAPHIATAATWLGAQGATLLALLR